jgi:catechol 2,3-dioxygenase-like lactoylglutathione lyase family enzyme
MPSVSGVLETALYVDDVQRAAEFYQRIFGFEVLGSDERLAALGVAGRQVLLLFKKGASLKPIPTTGGVLPPHDGAGTDHLAFSISREEFAAWQKFLAERGIAIESVVNWERGGRSLYFRDPDGHVVELATPGTWAIY